jgi:hypothetical protein
MLATAAGRPFSWSNGWAVVLYAAMKASMCSCNEVGKRGAVERLTLEDAKPGLDLIEP